MKIFMSIVLMAVLMGCTTLPAPKLTKEVAPQARLTVDTFGVTSMSREQQLCYAVGNVGFDAVINASNDVPIDVMMDLVDENNPVAYMLEATIKFAYTWESSPHEFGMHSYARCLHYLNMLDSIEA